MRAPVIPNGWPSAIAPPWGLSLSLNGSTPMPLAEGMTWAAKASLISTMSMSSIVIFARFHGGGLALHGVAVLLLAADLLAPSDVLSGLAHRNVDVGILLGVAWHEPGVVRIWRVGIAAAVPRNALDSDGKKHIAFAGL